VEKGFVTLGFLRCAGSSGFVQTIDIWFGVWFLRSTASRRIVAKEIAVEAREGEASRARPMVGEGASVETTREETRERVAEEVICVVGFGLLVIS
jgi:hypothetical protein